MSVKGPPRSIQKLQPRSPGMPARSVELLRLRRKAVAEQAAAVAGEVLLRDVDTLPVDLLNICCPGRDHPGAGAATKRTDGQQQGCPRWARDHQGVRHGRPFLLMRVRRPIPAVSCGAAWPEGRRGSGTCVKKKAGVVGRKRRHCIPHATVGKRIESWTRQL